MSLPAEALFPRDWRVVVQITDAEAVDVSALDIEFKILRSLKPSPNRAVVTLWNVNPEHRAQLLKRAKPQASGGAERPAELVDGRRHCRNPSGGRHGALLAL